MTPLDLPEDEAICDINVTPLVDVSLVLVILFMVMAPLVSQILKPLLLPQSARASLSQSNCVKVSLFADGTLAVGAALIPEAQLEDRLRREFGSGRTPWVVLRAPENAPHGLVMDLLKRIRQAGAQRVAFGAKPKARGGGLP